jgi:hypothetical protein
LPTYQAPYRLTVKSSRRGIGRTTEIYFPSGVYFDAEFQQLGEFGEDRQGPPYVVEGKEGSLENVRVVIPFGEANKSARYVLLFTRGDLVGEPVSVEGDVVSRAVLGAFRAKVERSLEGNVEIETRLDPKQN